LNPAAPSDSDIHLAEAGPQVQVRDLGRHHDRPVADDSRFQRDRGPRG
jgi:hypothetical protein